MITKKRKAEMEEFERRHQLERGCIRLREIPRKVMVNVSIAENNYRRGFTEENDDLINNAIHKIFPALEVKINYISSIMLALKRVDHPRVNELKEKTKAYKKDMRNYIDKARYSMRNRQDPKYLSKFFTRIIKYNEEFEEELINACDCAIVPPKVIRKVIVKREKKKGE